MFIGFDKYGKKLQIGDLCYFKYKNKQYEGIIYYDEEDYAFSFKIEDEKISTLLMLLIDKSSIKKIKNIFKDEKEKEINDDWLENIMIF